MNGPSEFEKKCLETRTWPEGTGVGDSLANLNKQIESLESQLFAATRERDEAEKVLEWYQRSYVGSQADCAFCSGTDEHSADCRLAAILKRRKERTQ